MDHLSDLCYLLQLILNQIFVYLRDFILHEFSWFASTNENIDDFEAKLQNSTSKQMTADFIALSSICGLLFVFMIASSKSNKNENVVFPTTADIRISTDALLEHPHCVTRFSNSSTMHYPRDCGDSIFPEEVDPEITFHVTEDSRSQLSEDSEALSKDTKVKVYPVHSQRTQTDERILQKTAESQEWLIRCTRSGHVYGKYPI